MDGTAGNIDDPLMKGLNLAFDRIFGPELVPESPSLQQARERVQDAYDDAHENMLRARNAMAALLPPMPQEALVAIEEYVDAKAKFADARSKREALGL